MNQNPETPSAVPDVKEEEWKVERREGNVSYQRHFCVVCGAKEIVRFYFTVSPVNDESDKKNRAGKVAREHNASIRRVLEKKEAVAESVALREVVDQMDAVCAACPVNPSEGKWEICKQCGTTWERRNGKLCGSRHLQGGSGRMCFPSREQWEAWRKRLAEWEQGAVSGLRDVQGQTELPLQDRVAIEVSWCRHANLTPHETARRVIAMLQEPKQGHDIEEMVSRFLAWPLPESVCSDDCATMRGYPNRSGTNLLTAPEARQMIEHLLLSEHAPKSDSASY